LFLRAAGLFFHNYEESKKYVTSHDLNKKGSKFYNKHLDDYTSLLTGPAIDAAIGSANEYCGFQELSVWKAQEATVCLSCLPNFHVNDLQTDQMTWMANVMGMGIWTESGDPSEFGFHITNEKGPDVSISDTTTTNATLTAKYESATSYLYWPDFFFAQNVVTTSELCGVTSAYDVGTATAVATPDPLALYHYVLVKVSSAESGLVNAPRGDATAAPPKQKTEVDIQEEASAGDDPKAKPPTYKVPQLYSCSLR
jgi:hypothetical protein